MALQAFTAEAQRRKWPQYSEITNHDCTCKCRFFEYNTKEHGKAFVCCFSRKVHLCGCHCTSYEETTEGYVCFLTGHMLPYDIERHYSKKQKGSDTKYIVNPPVRMGRSGKRRRKTGYVYHADTARTFLQDIFYGKYKSNRYNTNKQVFTNYCIKAFKQVHKIGHVDFLQQHKLMAREAHRLFGTSYAPPKPLPAIKIENLVRSIHDFWIKQADAGIYKTTNASVIFTAVCISKLRTGYRVGNTEIFPKVPWIAQNAPTDCFYSGIPQFKCRSMSIMWRRILNNTIEQASMLPKRGFIFVLK